jgi:hypothetical protein
MMKSLARRMGLAGREEDGQPSFQGSDSEATAGQQRTSGRARRERLEADLANSQATNQVSLPLCSFKVRAVLVLIWLSVLSLLSFLLIVNLTSLVSLPYCPGCLFFAVGSLLFFPGYFLGHIGLVICQCFCLDCRISALVLSF